MSSKKKILVFVDWYLPGYKAGGQIRSVANMAWYLRDEYDFYIVTSDTDLHETQPYTGIKKNEWTKGPDGTNVLYLPTEKQNYTRIKEIILAERADIIYLNSLFSKVFTLYPLMVRKRHLPVRKVVLAPRGMLGEGALQIKAFKKKTFLLWSKLTGLYRNIRWHASTNAEASEIKKVFGNKQLIYVALDLSDPREIKSKSRVKTPGLLRAAFLSRISDKKNLDGTLELLASLQGNGNVEFDIYGPIEEKEHWQRCEELMKKLPANIKATYKGYLSNEKVTETLQHYHLSILLTFNENFGHSIIESMAAGCPVLLSDQTPWRSLANQKAGWDIPLANTDEILSVLQKTIQMDQTEFDQWSHGAFEYAKKVIHNPEDIEQNRKLFS
ncbi:MAG: glycosyltransferase family 4 protein [Bacteroidetes bacterium]|nr:glycosyltransferase family 4 protein [Bacteroidota bacterium]